MLSALTIYVNLAIPENADLGLMSATLAFISPQHLDTPRSVSLGLFSFLADVVPGAAAFIASAAHHFQPVTSGVFCTFASAFPTLRRADIDELSF